MMWIQRTGMKFAQLKRHAYVSHLLTRVLYTSGAIEEWNTINAVLEVLVGDSDSLNPPGMLELTEASGIDDSQSLYDEQGFEDFVRRYNLQRSEGVLLRYLNQDHSTLARSVPEAARSDEVVDMIGYIKGLASVLKRAEKVVAGCEILTEI